MLSIKNYALAKSWGWHRIHIFSSASLTHFRPKNMERSILGWCCTLRVWQFAAAQLIRSHLFNVCLLFIVSCSFAFSFHYTGTFGSPPHMLINLLVHLSHFPPGWLTVTLIISVLQISLLTSLPRRSPTWTSKTGKAFFHNCQHTLICMGLMACLPLLFDYFTKDRAYSDL